ncbi:MAG TPA: SDR family NAD(P)-dependent oxidoreductase [Xanthobacteraceae bacterium]|nr:SDR family NAD(P)-dependent oxidoreductase [Xanthobacteraceae bacterium]
MFGKTVLVTGANSGIDFIAARELAAMGASVVMVCRDPDRGARARSEVSQAAIGAAPELLLADMSSQSSVRGLAEQLHQRFTTTDHSE